MYFHLIDLIVHCIPATYFLKFVFYMLLKRANKLEIRIAYLFEILAVYCCEKYFVFLTLS